MRWTGKIIGGLIGLWIAGPIGLIIGVFLGHIVDMGLLKQFSEHQRYQQFRRGAGSRDVFFQSVFRLMGYLAKSDGQVTRAEIAVAERIMDNMKLSDDLRQRAIELFNEGKSPNFQPNATLHTLRQHYAGQPNVLRMCHDVLQQIARADGPAIHPNKQATLNQIAQALGMAPFGFGGFDFNDFVNRFNQRSGGYGGGYRAGANGQRGYRPGFNQTPKENPYTVLGISNTASNADIKKRYRRLMSQYHPDKLVSKNLSKTEMAKATEKAQTIKAAYDQLKRERQF